MCPLTASHLSMRSLWLTQLIITIIYTCVGWSLKTVQYSTCNPQHVNATLLGHFFCGFWTRFVLALESTVWQKSALSIWYNVTAYATAKEICWLS